MVMFALKVEPVEWGLGTSEQSKVEMINVERLPKEVLIQTAWWTDW